MARRRTHAVVGAAVGLGAYTLIKWIRNEDWALGEAIAMTGCGALVACAPDLLEPAKNSNHRGACHSLALLALLVLADVKVLKSAKVSPEAKAWVISQSAAYASHLLVDATTPKRLPLLVPKFDQLEI